MSLEHNDFEIQKFMRSKGKKNYFLKIKIKEKIKFLKIV